MKRKIKKKPSPPLSLRLTETERAALEKAAGNRSLSAHIRECVLGETVQIRKSRNRNPTKDHEALARVLGLLGQSRIANNLNQLTGHAQNGTLLLDDETTEKINEAHEHVLSMRAELIRALGLIEEQRK